MWILERFNWRNEQKTKRRFSRTSLEKSTDWMEEFSPNVTRLPTMELWIETLSPSWHSWPMMLLISERFSLEACFRSRSECWIDDHWMSFTMPMNVIRLQIGPFGFHVLEMAVRWKDTWNEPMRSDRTSIVTYRKWIEFCHLDDSRGRSSIVGWGSLVGCWPPKDRYCSKDTSTQAARRKSKYRDNYHVENNPV